MGRGRRSRSIAAACGALLIAAAAASAQLPLPPGDDAPPAKARIAFVADGAIHTIAADGSDRRRLTPGPGAGRAVAENPDWAPDGSAVAFTRLSLDEDESLGVWLVNRDGSGLRRLAVPNSTGDSEPTWAPDGTRIAFVRYRAGKRRITASIVSVRPDGGDARTILSETTNLEDDVVFFGRPAWSPDGGRILFTRTVYGDDDFAPSLHVVPAAGGTASRVVRGGDEGTWHPSGDRIAYALRHDRSTGRACFAICDGGGEIYAANPDGSGRTRLTNSRANDAAPSWSGDGLRIAFHSDRNSTQSEDEDSAPELYSMRPDGSCVTWLTNGTAHSEWPAFERGPALSSDPGGCGAVPREPLVETDTRKAERFTAYPLWWLGRVAPNGLLLGAAEVRGRNALFVYDDCGRFDPAECGDFVLVNNRDLCRGGRLLPDAGLPRNPLSIFRGALLAVGGDDEIGYSDLYTGRSRIVADTASGKPASGDILKSLQRVDGKTAAGAPMPAASLPPSYWRTLTRVTAARRKYGSTAAAARRLRLSRAEVRRRLAAARRLAQLGVKSRLNCRG